VESDIECDSIADLPVWHCIPDACDDASRLVAHNDGWDAAACAPVHTMYIAAADATSLNTHQNFV
jgi:hypothetical protein